MKILNVIDEVQTLCERYGLRPDSIYIQVHSHFNARDLKPVTTSMTVFYKKENERTNFTARVYDKDTAKKEKLLKELEIILMEIMEIPEETQTEIEY